MHQACYSQLGPVNATIQATRTPIFHPAAVSSRQLYEPCAPSSSGRSGTRSVRAYVQAPAKSGGGDWSSRLLAVTKKKKEPKSPEDIFQPKRPAGFTEFGDEDGEEEEGPSAKRLPAEMRCAPYIGPGWLHVDACIILCRPVRMVSEDHSDAHAVMTSAQVFRHSQDMCKRGRRR